MSLVEAGWQADAGRRWYARRHWSEDRPDRQQQAALQGSFAGAETKRERMVADIISRKESVVEVTDSPRGHARSVGDPRHVCLLIPLLMGVYRMVPII